MPERIYKWKRHWYQKNSPSQSDSAGLSNFFDPWIYAAGMETTHEGTEINDLLDIPCLILLGEPGMGKSFALNEAYETILSEELNRCALYNLADFEHLSDLEEEIFQEEQFLSWQQDDSTYHLFLDSLDEARIHFRTIQKKLIKILSSINNESLRRLRLRITCRITDWPEEFELALRSIFSEENDVAAFVLAPLQKADVILAVNQNEALTDVDAFWDEVLEKKAQPFAERPITLKFLFDEYIDSRQLPISRKVLYEKGCRKLCAELNPSHSEKDKLSAEERFIRAAKIAATTIFTGHPSIKIKSFEGHYLNSLPIDSFFSEIKVDEKEFFISEEEVLETLDTALFHGREIREWAHQTYAEFLAAWYVSQALDIPQIKSLIFHPEGSLVPQLQETAAWISTFVPEIFDSILESDPEVLLRSDIAIGDDQSRENLVLALLNLSLDSTRFHFNWQDLPSLKCSNLALILKDFIGNKANPAKAREFGVDIAIACCANETQGLLASIALDETEPLFLRITCSQAVVKLGDDETKHQLKSLAFLSLEIRELGELKRFGILANWPKNLTTLELFDLLEIPTEEKLSDFYIYQNWVATIIPELNILDFPIALRWVKRQGKMHDLPANFVDLLNAILLYAWQYLEISEVAIAYAEALIALWQRYDHVIDSQNRNGIYSNNPNVLTSEIIFQDNRKRYSLLNHLIPLASKYERILGNLRFDAPLVNIEDATWLANYYHDSRTIQEQTFVANLFRYFVNFYDPEQLEIIYGLGQQNLAFWKEFENLLFVVINSEQATSQKKSYQLSRDLERQVEENKIKQKRPLLETSPKTRVLSHLDNFEKGMVKSWWIMSYWMMVTPEGLKNGEHDFEFNLENLPVWEDLTEHERARIINSASSYLHKFDPNVGECGNSWWEDLNSVYWPILAGCRAALAVIKHDQVEQFDYSTWKKWAPALTYYVYRSLTYSLEENIRKQNRAFLKFIQLVEPEDVNETILWIGECENSQQYFFLISRIDHLWGSELVTLFLSAIRKDLFKLENEAQILDAICEFEFASVDSLLMDRLEYYKSEDSKRRIRAVNAAKLILEYAVDARWPVIWNLFLKSTEFGKDVVNEIVSLENRKNRLSRGSSKEIIVSKLDESSIAELYMWMFIQYSPKDDPPREDGFSPITLEHEIASFRDSLPHRLAERGNENAIKELKQIELKLNLDLQEVITPAKVSYLRQTWNPLLVSEFRDMINNKQRRWIQSNSQLQDAIIELLEKLNLELQGKNGATPSAIDLWNEHGKNSYTPKDENRLSDYVERFLKKELEGHGVFISRENQIRRGSFTDIYVEAVSTSQQEVTSEVLSVVVEVKGCWHEDLKKAMQTQLQDRYMAENNVRYGIYLVGQFMCEKWDKNVNLSKWRKSPKEFDAIEKFLQDQANELSNDIFLIKSFILDARL